MDNLKFPISRHDADLIGQALDVYATTLMCAPLGLGLDLMVDVRALRDRLEHVANQHETLQEALSEDDGNVVAFARA